MWRVRRLWLRLLATVRSGRADADLAREIDAHLGLLEDDYRSRGYEPEQARRAARIAIGGAESVKERQRDARSFRWLEDLRRDVPYAVRSLSRTPGAAMAAILTLALGIGTTTAIFTLFDGVLLEPLPVNRPDELRVVRQLIRFGGRIEKSSTDVPYHLFEQLQRRSDVFSETIAFARLRDAVLSANGRDTALPAGGVFVSDNYFAVLGVTAALGRAPGPGDGAGVEPAAVLSHACWRREFAGDRSVVGRPIRINGAAFTVVGVAPPRFFGLVLGEMPDVFLPVESLGAAQPALSTLADRANWTVQIAGRLQATVTDAVAADRLTAFRGSVLPPTPGQANWQVDALPIETGLSDVRDRFARPLSILFGMGALLLLIACANVATLLGARASSRRSELVIRTAIGAGRGRLLRQLATESVVLAVAAGAVGVVFASWATRALFGLMPQGSTPLALDVALDRRVLAFSVTISILTAIVAGVVPALRAVGFDLAAALRDRSHAGEHGAGRARSFAVVQVAMCVVLVIASAMFARTLHTLTTIDPGFRAEGLFQVTVEPGARLIRGPGLDQFYRGAYERLRAVPGVRAVTSSQMPLLDHGQTTGTIEVPGFQPSLDDERLALMFQVGPDFFGTTGIAVIGGRDFTEQDVAGARRVAAINDVAARRFFGTRDPIGGTVFSDGGYQIVAVVRSAKYNTLRDQDRAVMFVPYTTVRQRPRMTLLVRAGGRAEPPAAAMAAAARGGDPLIPIEITPATMFVERSLSQERLLAMLSTFFAAAALVLLSVSLYGIMSFWVAERAAEIGIHLALGAPRSRIRWVVIRQPLGLAGLGIAIGVPAAVAASRAVDSLMFGVGPRDPLTIAGAVVVILVVTVAACIAPARRAARVDPMTALRCE